MFGLLAAVSSIAPAGGTPTENTYHVDDAGGDAWWEVAIGGSTISSWPNLTDVNANNYTSGNETTVSTDNTSGISAEYTGCAMGPPDAARAAHRFLFDIAESGGSLTKITPTLKGVVASTGTANGIIAGYIWNYDTTSWDSFDSEANPEDLGVYTLTAELTTGLANYVSGGQVQVLFFMGHTNCVWSLTARYAELIINAVS